MTSLFQGVREVQAQQNQDLDDVNKDTLSRSASIDNLLGNKVMRANERGALLGNAITGAAQVARPDLFGENPMVKVRKITQIRQQLANDFKGKPRDEKYFNALAQGLEDQNYVNEADEARSYGQKFRKTESEIRTSEKGEDVVTATEGNIKSNTNATDVGAELTGKKVKVFDEKFKASMNLNDATIDNINSEVTKRANDTALNRDTLALNTTKVMKELSQTDSRIDLLDKSQRDKFYIDNNSLILNQAEYATRKDQMDRQLSQMDEKINDARQRGVATDELERQRLSLVERGQTLSNTISEGELALKGKIEERVAGNETVRLQMDSRELESKIGLDTVRQNLMFQEFNIKKEQRPAAMQKISAEINAIVAKTALSNRTIQSMDEGHQKDLAKFALDKDKFTQDQFEYGNTVEINNRRTELLERDSLLKERMHQHEVDKYGNTLPMEQSKTDAYVRQANAAASVDEAKAKLAGRPTPIKVSDSLGKVFASAIGQAESINLNEEESLALGAQMAVSYVAKVNAGVAEDEAFNAAFAAVSGNFDDAGSNSVEVNPIKTGKRRTIN